MLPDEERRALLDKVEAFGATLGEPIAMPYVTDLFCARLAAYRPWAGVMRSAASLVGDLGLPSHVARVEPLVPAAA